MEEIKFRLHESIEEAEKKKTEGMNVEILTSGDRDTIAEDIRNAHLKVDLESIREPYNRQPPDGAKQPVVVEQVDHRSSNSRTLPEDDQSGKLHTKRNGGRLRLAAPHGGEDRVSRRRLDGYAVQIQ
tara:strand:- start:424 stop:804 length:381 start_codon:yes stop_codon:yes gene_type:complete